MICGGAIALLVLCLMGGASALAAKPPKLPAELGVSEAEAESMLKDGRLKSDDLIRARSRISWWTKMRLYAYAQELDPFFEGVEEAMRQLARADCQDVKTVDLRRDELSSLLRQARDRVMESGRSEPETDWRRGLLGLIYLDQEWRKRVYERQKKEIKNPYDLVDLIDCLDANLRGLKTQAARGCQPRILQPAKSQKDALYE